MPVLAEPIIFILSTVIYGFDFVLDDHFLRRPFFSLPLSTKNLQHEIEKKRILYNNINLVAILQLSGKDGIN